MALKSVLKKEEFDALGEAVRSYYKQDGDKYIVDLEDVDNLPAMVGMRRAKEQERDAHNATTTALAAAKEKNTKLQNDLDEIHRGNVPKDNIEKLENSWKQKLADANTESDTKYKKLETQMRGLLVDNVAQSLAAKISTAPELMLPHIQKRLTTHEENGQLVTRVLGLDGTLSAASLADLEKELLQNAAFSAILVGSKSNGSGASGGNGGGGASKSWAEMSERERSDLYLADPTKYRKMRDEAKQAKK